MCVCVRQRKIDMACKRQRMCMIRKNKASQVWYLLIKCKICTMGRKGVLDFNLVVVMEKVLTTRYN